MTDSANAKDTPSLAEQLAEVVMDTIEQQRRINKADLVDAIARTLASRPATHPALTVQGRRGCLIAAARRDIDDQIRNIRIDVGPLQQRNITVPADHHGHVLNELDSPLGGSRRV